MQSNYNYVITHFPYNCVNLKQGSSHMVKMAHSHNIRTGHVSQQLFEPVASHVVPAIVSRE